ncbi:hypothetical protein Esti_001570 [Eimeria stiedai]
MGSEAGREEEAPTAAAAAPDGSKTWCLYASAHRVYLQQQLERGLRLLAATVAAEETLETPAGAAAAAPSASFMELQQQQGSLLSGVYWILCGLALLQPPPTAAAAAARQQQKASPLLLPQGLREALVNKVILRCLRRQHTTSVSLLHPRPSNPSAAAAAQTAAAAAEARRKPATSEDAAAEESSAFASLECSSSSSFVVGFSSSPAKEAVAAALPTCSGLQALALLEALPLLSEETLQRLRRFVLLLQRQTDGAFANTLPSCRCSSCSTSAAAAAAAGAAAAGAAAADDLWEHEGDVRCTFCCLLSLRLIHAEATARRLPTAQASAAAAAAAGAADEPCMLRVGAGGANEPRREDASWALFLNECFSGVRVEETVVWLLSLVGTDGGVAVSPGGEAHAGAAFCFAGCLALLNKTHTLSHTTLRRLERWLRERQLPDGSLQGRPGKAGDTCYTFWISAALLLLGKQPLQLLRPAALAAAVAAAQHPSGGIARAPAAARKAATAAAAAAARDVCASAASQCFGEGPEGTRPTKRNGSSSNDSSSSGSHPLQFLSAGLFDSGEEQLRRPDPFHTFFALAGLSLLAHSESMQQQQQQEDGGWRHACRELLQPFDPATALPRASLGSVSSSKAPMYLRPQQQSDS